MLAYRCEDINRRLEPQELFTRKEQEQTLQLDVSNSFTVAHDFISTEIPYQVAEGCILKWLRKKVKPIVKRQRERETVNVCTVTMMPMHACIQLPVVIIQYNNYYNLFTVSESDTLKNDNLFVCSTDSEMTIPHYRQYNVCLKILLLF